MSMLVSRIFPKQESLVHFYSGLCEQCLVDKNYANLPVTLGA